MLESIFIILLIIAILLLVLGVEWESLAITGIDIGLWLVLAISIHQLEIPYQYESGGQVFTGTQSIESLFPLSILFYGIAFIVFIYLMVNLVFPLLSEKIKDRKML